jgi:Mrp family chromosome partitioning ATPase
LNLTRRLNEIQIQEAGARSEWEIVDRAAAPSAPTNASGMARYLAAFFAGIAAAILLVFVNQSLRAPLRGIPNHEILPGLSTLSPLPRLSGKSFRLKTKLTAVEEDASRLLVTEQPHYEKVMNAVYSSVFRIMEASQKGTPPVIVVTSPGDGEGKSVVAANLAVGFAATGLRTLLIDGHFQRPQIQNIFKLPFSAGMASLLAGLADTKSVAYPSRFSGLAIVPRGTAPLGPAQATLTPLAKALERLKKNQDVVVIDAGSINGDSTTMLWSSLATDIIMVARHGISLHGPFLEALPRMKASPHSRVWAILNDKPMGQRQDLVTRIQRSVRKGSAATIN